MPQLEVHQLDKDDVFGDMVRVHLKHRPNTRAGHVMVVRVGGKEIFATARGAPSNNTSGVWLDSYTRQKLNIAVGTEYDFDFKPAGWWSEMIWAFNASDPTNRVAARLGLSGLVLGLIGLMLGIASLF